MSKRLVAALVVGIAIGTAVGALVLNPRDDVVTGFRNYVIRVRFVDAETAEPLSGVAVMAWREFAAPRRGQAVPCPWLPVEDWYPDAPNTFSRGHLTDGEGHVEYVYSEPWASMSTWGSPDLLPAPDGVCVVGKPGYGTTLLPWTLASKQIHVDPELDEPYAKVDFGTVKLQRESSK